MRSAILHRGATLLTAAVITGGLLACGPGQQAATPSPTPEELSPVTAKAVIVAARQARLSFPMLGRIAALPRVGDSVAVRQELARLDTSSLDLAISLAQDAVGVNEALIAQAQAPARDVDVASLEAAYQAAVAKRDKAAAGPLASDLAAARAAVTSAEAGLAAAQARLRQVRAGPTASDIAAAESALSAAKAALATAKARQDALDPNSAQHAADVRSAELALEQARNALWAAQTQRDGVCGAGPYAPKYQCDSANATVAAAETAVSSALNALENVRRPPTEEQIRAAAEAVAAAQQEQARAQARLDQLRAGPLPVDVSAAESEVTRAQSALASAKARLEALQTGAPEEVKAAEAEVARAKAALDQKKAGPAPADLEVLRARLKESRTALAKAQAARADAIITSPFAGTVVETTAKVGETIAAGTPVLTVADLSALVAETTDLDEAGAALLSVGMPVTVRINAFADKTLTGKISEIAQVATVTSSGDANYTVRIVLDQADPSLRLGMTARVEFPVGR